jgi:hypothetical protein
MSIDDGSDRLCQDKDTKIEANGSVDLLKDVARVLLQHLFLSTSDFIHFDCYKIAKFSKLHGQFSFDR